MRVLHLIDVMSPWGGACTQRLAADVIARIADVRRESVKHDVLMIGRHADVLDAAACGLRPVGSIWPLKGRTLSAARGLSRWLAASGRVGATPDVIHAWTATSGALAALAAAEVPRVDSPRPLAADTHSANFVSREMVRQRWQRDEGVAPDEFVLGLLGEPQAAFDARAAMHVGGRTGLSSRRIRLVLSGSAAWRAESERFLTLLGIDRVIVQDEASVRPWEVLRGLDAALSIAPAPSRRWHGESPSSLPVLMAMAAGVPVIAEADAPHDGLIIDERNGLVFPPRDLNAACLRLARLHDEHALAGRLANAGMETVSGAFSLDVFCTRLRQGYHDALHSRQARHVLTEVEQPAAAS